MNYTALHLSATKRSKFKFITMQGNPVYLCPINYNHKINSKIRNSTHNNAASVQKKLCKQCSARDRNTIYNCTVECRRKGKGKAVPCARREWDRGRVCRVSDRGR